MKLQNGTRIAVIGGGPAGSFFALYLRRFSEEAGLQPEITVYQDRDFDGLGPKGCKGCAGVLSMSLLNNLSELHLTLPNEIIQSQIDHYTVHSPYTSISISNPEKGKDILSVYRGGGPRISNYVPRISFDGWLLAQVRSQGIRVDDQRVTAIDVGENATIEAGERKTDYDLIVLASGVARRITTNGIDYIPPATRTMALDELYAGVDQVYSRLGTWRTHS
ncbi:MAG: hypothetical protein A2147_07365 [Chloroflexi bacterium RBG_16_57_8]|nr:MAG: hypothetical protein A2147_07365 [Chloroflexi bacterium RBG_16_57_8]